MKVTVELELWEAIQAISALDVQSHLVTDKKGKAASATALAKLRAAVEPYFNEALTESLEDPQ